MSTEAHSGAGIESVLVPGSTTPARHLRLIWRANLRAPGFRGPMIRFAVVAVVVLAVSAWLSPLLAVAWVLAVGACLGMTAWSNTVLWRRGGGDQTGAIVRPGGIEFVSPSSSSWFPSSQVERSVVSGPALVVQLRGRGRTTFDVDGLGEDDRSAIATLLAADASPDLVTPWRDVASWAATDATVKRARAARVGLVDDRWARIVPSVVVMFAVLLGLQWVVRWLGATGDLGLSEAARAAARELPSLAVKSAIITAVLVGVSMWTTYRSADRRAVGLRTVILGTDDELAVFSEVETVTRYTWSAVAVCRVTEEWIELVTDPPYETRAVPTWAFFEGERDRSIRAFEQSRAARG